jgi:hypothetical protein
MCLDLDLCGLWSCLGIVPYMAPSTGVVKKCITSMPFITDNTLHASGTLQYGTSMQNTTTVGDSNPPLANALTDSRGNAHPFGDTRQL